jgi:hypothetical protein
MVSRLFFFLILIILQTIGLLGRVISLSQGLYLNTGQHKHSINTYTYQTSMPCVGFEPTIPASERVKAVHALDCWVIVTGVEAKTDMSQNIGCMCVCVCVCVYVCLCYLTVDSLHNLRTRQNNIFDSTRARWQYYCLLYNVAIDSSNRS